ncbi:hypothetical protein NBRC3293_2832 [Gluconobacter oxydans NBRC 3293]|uniref:Uncharacterized protein n=1 Tax=Gluconobacter oxydans NBRC 3293 TaxID=1315969 RepID=A0A829WT24_GLUOY|nr:hypothetical protein NBRC3293_2832 [Gluconobacter oxydans NBRC 3293]
MKPYKAHVTISSHRRATLTILIITKNTEAGNRRMAMMACSCYPASGVS